MWQLIGLELKLIGQRLDMGYRDKYLLKLLHNNTKTLTQTITRFTSQSHLVAFNGLITATTLTTALKATGWINESITPQSFLSTKI